VLVDLLACFSVGFAAVGFAVFMNYLVSALCAFVTAVAGIYLMRFLTVRAGFSAFGYYSWGTALLAFILFLIA
jgi:hypothetical protein